MMVVKKSGQSLGTVFTVLSACISALNAILKTHFRPKSSLKTAINCCLRHQAVYSEPFHLITFCEGGGRLVLITTAANNSD